MSKGYVYVLTNPSMPGLVKIGKTTRSVSGRAGELYQTGVPTPFEVASWIFSPDCGELEASVHKQLEGRRLSAGREFFRENVSTVVEVLENEHRCQVELWLESFIPDHSIIENDLFICPSTVSTLAASIEVHPFEISQILEFLDPDDLIKARDRMLSSRQDRAVKSISAIEVSA